MECVRLALLASTAYYGLVCYDVMINGASADYLGLVVMFNGTVSVPLSEAIVGPGIPSKFSWRYP